MDIINNSKKTNIKVDDKKVQDLTKDKNILHVKNGKCTIPKNTKEYDFWKED